MNNSETGNEERLEKLNKLMASLSNSEAGLEMLRQAADKNGLSVLRHVDRSPFPAVAETPEDRSGVVIDVETTGTDVTQDKVTQLAMMRFRFNERGISRIETDSIFNKLNDPGISIPQEVTRLTGISNDDVKGKTISDEDIQAFLEEADIVIAHNAGFDRMMVENAFPNGGFDKRDWFCSLESVDWLMRGSNGRSLEILALQAGYTYGSHDALQDIMATAFVLNNPPGVTETSPFQEMIENGRHEKIMLVATSAPFASKDDLKRNGYHFDSNGASNGGYPKTWHKTIDDTPENRVAEAETLQQAFGRHVVLPGFQTTPRNQYSPRLGNRFEFSTENPTNVPPDLDNSIAVPEVN